LPVPVIIVGNITLGGTGKTPLVIWLVHFLVKAGYRPGIVTRGYGGTRRNGPIGVGIDFDPAEVGDEPVLLARRSGVPVVVDTDRPRGARFLIRQYSCDVVVSDDGLQHYALQRDFEIALIDGARRLGNGRCLPAGPLREPAPRLRSVDALIVNGPPQEGEWGMTLVAMGFQRVGELQTLAPVSQFRGQRVHAVAGIAHPQRFFEQLRRLGLEVIEHPFPDHHPYQSEDLRFNDALEIIMTEKDAVKCERLEGMRAWFLPVEAQSDARLGELVLRRLSHQSPGDTRG
jgi:tetraacyldisaccharide 4'-kinase